MLLLNRWCTILPFASVLAVTGAHPLIRPFRFPSISFSTFYPPFFLFILSQPCITVYRVARFPWLELALRVLIGAFRL
jgi:hypothetical protein